MKGILLAGGKGSRLYPLTRVASKQLQAVYDKPMIYYPLTTLIAAGIKEICLIISSYDYDKFKNLLGDGSHLGIYIQYVIQEKPKGIAHAILLAEEFIGDSNFALILGDNIFSGGNDIPKAINEFEKGALVFAYHVPDPERYAVVEFDSNLKVLSLEEKPLKPKSNYAVPGFYLYDKEAIVFSKKLKPSARGELEITDLNSRYLKEEQLDVHRLSRGYAWLDSGTSISLHEASTYIASIEKRQGMKIGCPEEAAFVRGFISVEELKQLVFKMPICDYKDYLSMIVDGYQTGLL